MVVSDLKIIFSEGQTENLNIENVSVKELLEALKMEPLEVIVKKDSLVLQEDETIQNNDEIKIIKVIHGG